MDAAFADEIPLALIHIVLDGAYGEGVLQLILIKGQRGTLLNGFPSRQSIPTTTRQRRATHPYVA
jgi:hypothetical protein